MRAHREQQSAPPRARQGLQILFALLIAFLPAPTLAECPILKKALKNKEDETLDFDAKNRAMLVSLIATETSCKNKGATVSGELAKAAAALTCQALQDANEVNLQMENLGKICTDAFTKRNQLQQMLQTTYTDMIADVEDGTEYILKSEILMADCPKEAKKAKNLRARARELATEIANVELRSRDGKENYGKFQEAAAAMAMLAAARNKGCATNVIEKVAANRERSSQQQPGGRSPAPPPLRRVSGHAPSDVTGTGEKEPGLDSLHAGAKIRKPGSRETGSDYPEAGNPNADIGNAAHPSSRYPSGRQSSGSQEPGIGRGQDGRSGHASKNSVAKPPVDRVQPKPEELLGDIALMAGKPDGESRNTAGSYGTGGLASAGVNTGPESHQGSRAESRAIASAAEPQSPSADLTASSGVRKLQNEEILSGVKELEGLRADQARVNSPDAMVGLDSVDSDLFGRVRVRYRKLEGTLRR